MRESIASRAEQIAGETIEFAQNYILINNSEIINNVQYDILIMPSNDYNYILWMLTLADIGLTESGDNYFAYVTVRTEDRRHFLGQNFYIKNYNTLIIENGDYFIIYERFPFEEYYRGTRGWARERPMGYVLPWE
jgi:hypothetical protein